MVMYYCKQCGTELKLDKQHALSIIYCPKCDTYSLIFDINTEPVTYETYQEED